VISGPDVLIFKLGRRENQIRPLVVETGQYHPAATVAELGHLIFQIRTEPFILGVLGPLAFGDPISESQATDRSTFCPMPGGRSQAASDGPPLRPFCLERGRQLRRLYSGGFRLLWIQPAEADFIGSVHTAIISVQSHFVHSKVR
jgi:hypothetical protein